MIKRAEIEGADMVALVEDDEGYSLLLKKLLVRHGVLNEVRLFDNSYKFLDFIQNWNSGSGKLMLLLDLNLPMMNGFELLKKIRKDFSKEELPVVVISTTARKSDVDMSYEIGCDAFIKKPIDFKELYLTATNLGIELVTSSDTETKRVTNE